MSKPRNKIAIEAWFKTGAGAHKSKKTYSRRRETTGDILFEGFEPDCNELEEDCDGDDDNEE